MKNEKKHLHEIIDGFAQKTIAVWGDFILDEYLYGTTRRISREAPVLILSYASKESLLGGAGNALLNLKALGAAPVPVGVVGQDEAGKKITRIFKKNNITTDFLLTKKNFDTPVKTRILAGEATARKQQILRIDKDSRVPEDKSLNQSLLQNLKRALRPAHALLIPDSHYFTVKKDLFHKILPPLKKKHTPVALDSRFRILDFKGVSVLTPNEPEVEFALRVDLGNDSKTITKAGRDLLKRTAAEAVVITRGAKGMVLFEGRKPPLEIPIQGTTDIVDVTGAGDTVISVFTLALACGATCKQAAQLANCAGGIVVMKKGTASVTAQELKEAVVF